MDQPGCPFCQLDEASAPIMHYKRTIADIWASLAYVERAMGKGESYKTVVARHLGRIAKRLQRNVTTVPKTACQTVISCGELTFKLRHYRKFDGERKMYCRRGGDASEVGIDSDCEKYIHNDYFKANSTPKMPAPYCRGCPAPSLWGSGSRRRGSRPPARPSPSWS
jgi:hypothetical protein